MHDSNAHSRQVYAIYDCLDEQNPKQALSLCLKARKKYPDSVLLQALHSLTLIRLGKVADAEHLLVDVLALPPDQFSEASLFPLKICLRDLGRYGDCVALYERCFQHNPTNLGYGIQLFLSLCYTKEFQKQYQLSTKLYKGSPGKQSKFLYWGITSLVLQYKTCDKQPEIYIKIAQKLAERLMEEGSVTLIDEVRLLVQVLHQSGAFQQALQLVARYEDLFEDAESYSKVYATLLRDSCNWKDLYQFVRRFISTADSQGEIINLNVDWSFFVLFIQSCCELLKILNVTVDTKVATVQGKFQNESVESDGYFSTSQIANEVAFLKAIEVVDRNSAVAKCHVTRNLGKENEFATSLWEMYLVLRDKDCCLRDVWSFYQEAATAQQHAAFELFVENYKSSPNWHLLRLLRGLSHLGNLQLTCPPPPQTLQCSQDEIFYNILVRLSDYDEFNNAKALNSAYVMTKELLSMQPSNFIYQILYIVQAQQLGLFMQACEEFDKLDIKNIQLDSLLYLLAENVCDFGYFERGIELFQKAFQLYYSNRKDVFDLLQYAFKQGKYEQVVDFCSFQLNLENSLQWLMIEGQTLAIEPIISVKQLADIESFYTINEKYADKVVLTPEELVQLTDNRDFTLLEFEAIGHRYGFIKKLFMRKSAVIPQLFSMLQLLCKRIQEQNQDEIDQLRAKYQKLFSQIDNGGSYFFIFNYFNSLFLQDFVECIHLMKNEINTFTLSLGFEQRILLTHLVICFCYSCLFALVKKNVPSGLETVGLLLLELIEKVQMKEFTVDANELRWIGVERLNQHIESTRNNCVEELEQIKKSFSKLIKQKLSLVSSIR